MSYYKRIGAVPSFVITSMTKDDKPDISEPLEETEAVEEAWRRADRGDVRISILKDGEAILKYPDAPLPKRPEPKRVGWGVGLKATMGIGVIALAMMAIRKAF